MYHCGTGRISRRSFDLLFRIAGRSIVLGRIPIDGPTRCWKTQSTRAARGGKEWEWEWANARECPGIYVQVLMPIG